MQAAESMKTSICVSGNIPVISANKGLRRQLSIQERDEDQASVAYPKPNIRRISCGEASANLCRTKSMMNTIDHLCTTDLIGVWLSCEEICRESIPTSAVL